MKKIISILGSLLFITAVKAQTTVVKKETVNPGNSQTTATASSKDPKAAAIDPKKEEAERIAAQRAAKDAKLAQHADPKTLPIKDLKEARVDPKKAEAERIAAQRAAKDAKLAQHADSKTLPIKDLKEARIDPKKEAEQKAAAEREAKNANTLHKGN